MKKRFLSVFVPLLLAMTLMLTGCTPLNQIRYLIDRYLYNNTLRTIPFDEIVYERPDLDEMFSVIDDVIEVVRNNGSYDEQLNAVYEVEELYYHFYTMSTVSYIRYTIDLTDEFYRGEYDFFAESEPLFCKKIEEFYIACKDSKYVDKLEEDYFGEGYFDDYEDNYYYLDDDFVALLQQENDKISEYIGLVSDAKVDYKGADKTLDELWYDDSVTFDEYTEYASDYYNRYNQTIGNLYVELIKVRQQIARTCGYDSYISYAYDQNSKEYTPDDVDAYVRDIKRYIVPIYEELNREDIYNNIGASTLRTEKEILGILDNATENMSDFIHEIYDFMEEYNLYDIGNSPDKISGSYAMYIDDYDAPFIVMNSEGYIDDLLTLSHEFGHFVDAYYNYGIYTNNDESESYSQAMEFLILNYIDKGCTKEEIDYLKKHIFLDAIEVYILQSYYNEFEEAVYSLDEEDVTIDNINRIAGELALEYGLSSPDDPGHYYTKDWIDISHLFENPFYVISYCISYDVALQIYALEREDKGAGVEMYIDMLQRDWDKTFFENLEEIGLDNPFSEGRIKKAARVIRENFD